jgi:F420-dependent oxidoreductase-like protein
MHIGLSGGGRDADRMIEQAVEAEADGFHALWYAGAIGGDPLVAMAVAGRATERIELGTSVLQTYTAHPYLMANRAAAVSVAMKRPGFVLGVGPSHEIAIAGQFAMDYGHVGRHTEEHVAILTALLRGETLNTVGEDLSLRGGFIAKPPHPVPVLVAALAPRLLRVAGSIADGTILWMANAAAVRDHVAPLIGSAAAAAGRPAPRIVAGLPVAVHDDVAEARRAAGEQFAVYGTLPNYQRILAHGGVAGPADAAIVGDEAAVAEQLHALLDAGATDIWAATFPVGDDRAGSRARTRALLKELANTA